MRYTSSPNSTAIMMVGIKTFCIYTPFLLLPNGLAYVSQISETLFASYAKLDLSNFKQGRFVDH